MGKGRVPGRSGVDDSWVGILVMSGGGGGGGGVWGVIVTRCVWVYCHLRVRSRGMARMPLLSYLMACGHGGSVAVDCAFRWARHDGRVVRACTGAMEGVSAVT